MKSQVMQNNFISKLKTLFKEEHCIETCVFSNFLLIPIRFILFIYLAGSRKAGEFSGRNVVINIKKLFQMKLKYNDYLFT